MSAWNKRWWDWGGRGALICRCVPPGVDTPLVGCLDETDYEIALGKLDVAPESWRCPIFHQQLS